MDVIVEDEPLTYEVAVKLAKQAGKKGEDAVPPLQFDVAKDLPSEAAYPLRDWVADLGVNVALTRDG